MEVEEVAQSSGRDTSAPPGDYTVASDAVADAMAGAGEAAAAAASSLMGSLFGSGDTAAEPVPAPEPEPEPAPEPAAREAAPETEEKPAATGDLDLGDAELEAYIKEAMEAGDDDDDVRLPLSRLTL
jgi:hypothetical protein